MFFYSSFDVNVLVMYVYVVSTKKEHVMAKDAVFTMKLEPELRAEFIAETATEDRSGRHPRSYVN